MRRVKRSLVFKIPFAQNDSAGRGSCSEEPHTVQDEERNSVDSQRYLSVPSCAQEVPERLRSSTLSPLFPKNPRATVHYDELWSLDSRPTSAQSPVCLVIRKKLQSGIPSIRKDRAPRRACRYVFSQKRRAATQRIAAAKQALYLVRGVSPVKVPVQLNVSRRPAAFTPH